MFWTWVWNDKTLLSVNDRISLQGLCNNNTDESRGIRPEELIKKVNRAILLTLHVDFNQIKTIYAPHPEGWRTPPVCDPVCLSVVLGCVRGSGSGCRTAVTHNNTLISSHYIKKQNTISPVIITCWTKWITNPCAVCDKRVNVVFSLVVIVQTASVNK